VTMFPLPWFYSCCPHPLQLTTMWSRQLGAEPGHWIKNNGQQLEQREPIIIQLQYA